MRQFLPVLKKDAYKIGHPAQYRRGTVLIYSNITSRMSRVEGVKGVMSFAQQYFVLDTLIDQFNRNFFLQDRGAVVRQYQRRVDSMLGPGTDCRHIGELHELGYLPLHIKAIPEGLIVPLRVPMMTMWNTDDRFYWLTNMIETMASNTLWRAFTSATTSFEYRKVFEKYARETGSDPSFVKWQGHDFSCRGLDEDSSIVSGAAHLLSFTGTDTILALDFHETYYGANTDTELVGGSVHATEHSVMCMGGPEGEFDTIDRLLFDTYRDAPVTSIVCDTWGFWRVVTEYVPSRKDRILERSGKFVIRPDSGDPVKILCGDDDAATEWEVKGLIQCLWDIFGGTYTTRGFKLLDPHIGAIYGDSITRDRQDEILARLHSKGFASQNVVLGIGSFTFALVTRDTYGIAMKATYGEYINEERVRIAKNIFKKPATDDGVKNSAKGLLKVVDTLYGLQLWEECDWVDEAGGVLQDIFIDGADHNFQTLQVLRGRVDQQVNEYLSHC